MISEDYEEIIQRTGGIDLLISGIGVNGHIAFNEPGSPIDSRTRMVELAHETIDLMRPQFVPEELPKYALTIGLATIEESRRILLLASGVNKTHMLKRAITGPVTTDVPASILQHHKDVTVIADEEAAAELPPDLISREPE
jgi:glucosamine-6-phosphate deaminase